MAAVSSSSPRLCPSGIYLSETAPSRKFKGFLDTILHEMGQKEAQDVWSLQLKSIIQVYLERLRKESPSNLEGEFIHKLRELLVDPFGRPIDEEAVLGSDGIVYGGKSLRLFLSHLPISQWHAAPFDPQNATPFTTQPHLFLQWLASWQPVQAAFSPLTSQDQIRFEEFMKADALAFLPTERTYRLRNLFEKQWEKREAALKKEQQLFAEAYQMMQQAKVAMSEQIVTTFAKLDTDTVALFQEEAEQLEKLKESERAKEEILQREIDQLKQKIAVLAQKTEEMTTDLELLEQQLSFTQAEEEVLAVAIQKTEVEIEKRKYERWKRILTFVAITGGCAASVWLLEGAGICSSFKVVPGGLSFHVSF